MENANNNTNSAYTNKLIVAEGPKRKVDILPMLVIFIASGKSTKNAIFIIGLTMDIWLIFVGGVDIDIKRIVKGKIVELLTRAGNADKTAAGWGLER